ncbi:hypothetical protein JCGZ_03787 [Jatropha curcas]|uniref:Uncharacterized protein n=1 Tax=Jatropha curcas TaxID=180498 RepID=A0A067KXP4_JATCU|nr:hypothetical protein JCGZ_03787 [Jatropha curcas]
MRMVVRRGDTYRLAGVDDQPEEDALDEEAEVGVEGDEGGVKLEVLARILSMMDMFGDRVQHMEIMVFDHFTSLDVSYRSIHSRLDTMQNQYMRLTA